MKKILTHLLAWTALSTLLATPAAAQEDAALQAELQEKFEHKMQSAFVSSGNWLTDYEQARKIAKQEGKLMFVYFTRSYAP